MWIWSYLIVALVFLFWSPGVSFVMLLLLPVIYFFYALITVPIEMANARREKAQAQQQSSTADTGLKNANVAVYALDPAIARRNAEEAQEQLRLVEEQSFEKEAASDQSFVHHHEFTSAAPSADEHTSWQDHLEADARG